MTTITITRGRPGDENDGWTMEMPEERLTAWGTTKAGALQMLALILKRHQDASTD